MNYLDEQRIVSEEQSVNNKDADSGSDDEKDESALPPVHQEQRVGKSERLSVSGQFSAGNK
jgi:hypothetical protein